MAKMTKSLSWLGLVGRLVVVAGALAAVLTLARNVYRDREVVTMVVTASEEETWKTGKFAVVFTVTNASLQECRVVTFHLEEQRNGRTLYHPIFAEIDTVPGQLASPKVIPAGSHVVWKYGPFDMVEVREQLAIWRNGARLRLRTSRGTSRVSEPILDIWKPIERYMVLASMRALELKRSAGGKALERLRR